MADSSARAQSREGQSGRADARTIFDHALERVLPEPALRRYMSLDKASNALIVAGRPYDLKVYDRVIVVGGGKAARRTAAELVNILGDWISAGVLNVYQDQAREPLSKRIKLMAADHPTPNQEGVDGARQMIELLKAADAKTLVIALISGGGSSLMAVPVEGVSLDDYKEISRLLLTVPATIDEINAVRKHLDPLKGGGMRKYAARAGGFISLVLSDVPVTKTGIVDDRSVIASGPTVGDDSTFQMAQQILKDHGIWDKTPQAIRNYIEANLGKEDNETLRKDSPLLAEEKSQYVMVANNDQAMEAACEKAQQLGYTTHLVGWKTGTTNDKIKAEVTQEIENVWKVIAPHVMRSDQITFGSFSTDGIDGHSDLAGAIADADTLKVAASQGLDPKKSLAGYDSATFFKELGLGIKTGATGTNVADVTVVLITNPNNSYRKLAFVFGGEATVKVTLPEGQKPGYGGRNTHLVLLAAEKIAQRPKSDGRLDSEAVKKGLVAAGVPESQIETSDLGRLGYASDVGPVSLKPLAIVGVRSHADVEKAVKFAYENGVPITARGAGSGLPGQSVGSGIVLDMRALVKMEVLQDHPDGGKIVFAEAGVICTRLNNFLKGYGVFLASYPASTDMATIGGMVANNSSGANSCKLGTTMHQVLDLRVVLSDGTSLWTSEVKPGKEPWNKILELVRRKKDVIERDFPRVPKNSSGYNVLDIEQQLEAGVPVDWSRLFAHSEGTLGVITEAKLRAVPLATQKATCIVYFTDLQEACGSIPRIYGLAPSCFDTAVTTNLDLIRKTFPSLGIREDAKAMYLIEFDDLDVQADPRDPAGRIGKVRVMEKAAAAGLIQKQVEALETLLKTDYPKTAVGFDVARDPARQDALWLGRRGALNVLYGYSQGKRPLADDRVRRAAEGRDEDSLVHQVHGTGVQRTAGGRGHARARGRLQLPHLPAAESLRSEGQRAPHQRDDRPHAEGDRTGRQHERRARRRTHARRHSAVCVRPRAVRPLSRDQEPDGPAGRSSTPGSRSSGKHATRTCARRYKRWWASRRRTANSTWPALGIIPISIRASAPCVRRAPTPARYSAGFRTNSRRGPRHHRASSARWPWHSTGRPIWLLSRRTRCMQRCSTSACSAGSARGSVRPRPRCGTWSSRSAKKIAARSWPRCSSRSSPIARSTTRSCEWPVSRKTSGTTRWVVSSSLPCRRGFCRRRCPPIGMFRDSPRRASSRGTRTCTTSRPLRRTSAISTAARLTCWRSRSSRASSTSPSTTAGRSPFRLSAVAESRLPPSAIRRKPTGWPGTTLTSLLPFKYVVAHCPSCILGFKDYAKEFARAGDTVYQKKAEELVAKLYDPARFIMQVIGPDNLKPLGNGKKQKVTVHVSCHEKLGHKMGGSVNATTALLQAIPGLELVAMKGADECCGQGGPWGLAPHYDLSVKMRRDKIANVIDSRADIATSWCMGCMVQMRDGLGQTDSNVIVRHPLELLSDAYGR